MFELIAQEITVKGQKLTCPICKNQKFYDISERTEKVFFIAKYDRDVKWPSTETVTYVCTGCGHFNWFLKGIA